MAKFDVKALRQKVMTSDDIKHDEIYVSEWDATLPIRTLSSAEMKEVMKHKDDQIRMLILAVLHGCKTPEGEKVFEQTDLAKFEAEKAFGPVAKVARKVLDLSGMDGDEVEDAKN